MLLLLAVPLVVAVRLGADDLKALVELDVDVAPVGQRDLDLVQALLVADLGFGDLAATGVRERAAFALASAAPVIGASEASSSPPAIAAAADRGCGEDEPGDDRGLRFLRRLGISLLLVVVRASP